MRTGYIDYSLLLFCFIDELDFSAPRTVQPHVTKPLRTRIRPERVMSTLWSLQPNIRDNSRYVLVRGCIHKNVLSVPALVFIVFGSSLRGR